MAPIFTAVDSGTLSLSNAQINAVANLVPKIRQGTFN